MNTTHLFQPLPNRRSLLAIRPRVANCVQDGGRMARWSGEGGRGWARARAGARPRAERTDAASRKEGGATSGVRVDPWGWLLGACGEVFTFYSKQNILV